jgi:predicted metal-dependent HD superfamily phosphohydrolase
MPPTMVRTWTRAVTELGGRTDTAALGAADLLRRYAEPHRRYHTGAHIEAMLTDAAELAHEMLLAPQEGAALRLAICAHDVVYCAQPGADERASAQWARDQLTVAGVDCAAIDRVALLILQTADHHADDSDVTAAVLMDADLAILAAPLQVYDAYVAAVRAEYAQVPDEQWQVGRAQLLRGLLDRDRLYRTGPATRRWDTVARKNVARELDQLDQRG